MKLRSNIEKYNFHAWFDITGRLMLVGEQPRQGICKPQNGHRVNKNFTIRNNPLITCNFKSGTIFRIERIQAAFPGQCSVWMLELNLRLAIHNKWKQGNELGGKNQCQANLVPLRFPMMADTLSAMLEKSWIGCQLSSVNKRAKRES